MRGKTAKTATDQFSLEDRLRVTLQEVLGLNDEITQAMMANSELFGSLPELDSMAVATLLTEIEDRFQVVIDDDDVDGEIFETFGALTAFIAGKIDQDS